jgi:Cdc6-like AAA superfamily ATPase
MSESAIFKNKSKLSPRYLPEELPHRQAQIQQILHVFSDAPSAACGLIAENR